ncbi:hypothetical protein [Paenibacillus marinisediminis]
MNQSLIHMIRQAADAGIAQECHQQLNVVESEASNKRKRRPCVG